MSVEANKILSHHKIKITSTRIEVLRVFLKEDKVLTLQEISQNLDKTFDRVTLYRILNTFEENGIIHKIPDNSGNINYALCRHECNTEHHIDNHVHFKCIKCNSTFCMDHIKIPEVKLEKGFSMIKYNYLIEGNCNACNNIK